jgi:hypothetical protein
VQSQKEAKPRNKKVEKGLLPSPGKESMGVISKQYPPRTKEAYRFYLGSLYIFI